MSFLEASPFLRTPCEPVAIIGQRATFPVDAGSASHQMTASTDVFRGFLLTSGLSHVIPLDSVKNV